MSDVGRKHWRYAMGLNKVKPRIATAWLCIALASCTNLGSEATPQNRMAESNGMCGVLANIQCGTKTDYCKSEPGICTRVADYSGKCVARPEACTMIYDPVCGCDGATYGNACTAATNGVSVAYEGECRDGG
jgi:hypothetical protein